MSCHWHVFLLFMGFCNVFAKQTIPNVDTKNPIIFEHSGNSNDYFGHGVAIGKQMAIIGGPGSDTHGQIFKCEFNGKGGMQTVSCSELPGKICTEISKKKKKKKMEVWGSNPLYGRSKFFFVHFLFIFKYSIQNCISLFLTIF